MKRRSIAIDGPAGAGKSTLARQVAKELGFLYVDTGAIYRTVALKTLRCGVDASQSQQVIPLLDHLDIRMDYGPDGGQRMFLEGEDVSQAIREHQVSGIASQVAAIPAVRDFLLEFQRKLAREHDVVMDGRDIGTVVLPQADDQRILILLFKIQYVFNRSAAEFVNALVVVAHNTDVFVFSR